MKLLSILLLLALLPHAGLAQEQAPAPPLPAIEAQSGFFPTFLKTPFVFVSSGATLSGCAIAGFFEAIYSVFTGFRYDFPITRAIWAIGWQYIIVAWWWQPATGWHAVLSFLFWAGALGGSSRRKKQT